MVSNRQFDSWLESEGAVLGDCQYSAIRVDHIMRLTTPDVEIKQASPAVDLLRRFARMADPVRQNAFFLHDGQIGVLCEAIHL